MPTNLQASEAAEVLTAPPRRAMNAFKHGARCRSLLLPGDDVQELQALRDDLVRQYRPYTREELRCVHGIADCEWRMDRFAHWETIFAGKLDALLGDNTGTLVQPGDPDSRYWQRCAADCTKQEVRFDHELHRTERRLFRLQELRRMGLLARGDELLKPDDAGMAAPAAVNDDASTPPGETGASRVPPPGRKARPAPKGKCLIGQANLKMGPTSRRGGSGPGPQAPPPRQAAEPGLNRRALGQGGPSAQGGRRAGDPLRPP